MVRDNLIKWLKHRRADFFKKLHKACNENTFVSTIRSKTAMYASDFYGVKGDFMHGRPMQRPELAFMLIKTMDEITIAQTNMYNRRTSRRFSLLKRGGGGSIEGKKSM